MSEVTKEDLRELKDHIDTRFDRMSQKIETVDGKEDQLLADLNAHKLEDAKYFGQVFTAIGQLTVKSGIWGAIAGAIPVVIALILWALKGAS